MGKTKKVMAGITSTALMMGLASCGVGNKEQGNDEDWNSGSQGGSSSMDIPPAPEDQNCEEWEWDLDDGVWECATAGPDIMDIFSTLACFMRSNPCCIKAKLIPTIKKAPYLKDAARVPEPTIL